MNNIFYTKDKLYVVRFSGHVTGFTLPIQSFDTVMTSCLHIPIFIDTPSQIFLSDSLSSPFSLKARHAWNQAMDLFSSQSMFATWMISFTLMTFPFRSWTVISPAQTLFLSLKLMYLMVNLTSLLGCQKRHFKFNMTQTDLMRLLLFTPTCHLN